ncbi:transcriptional regulator [Curtobacterium sp. MCBD17_008]|nr:transcriptional regulator [Curtobacterium sp. MCBD17_008]
MWSFDGCCGRRGDATVETRSRHVPGTACSDPGGTVTAPSAHLGDYLRARRALVRPTDVAIISSRTRRVPGLRRSEVAQLAGISQEYYLRLEQGRDRRPSHQVLAAIGRALLLDPVAVEHMHRLAKFDEQDAPYAVPAKAAVVDGLTDLVDGLTDLPALVISADQDVLAANPLARLVRPRLQPGSNVLFELFSSHGRADAVAWADDARRAVANLRFHGDPRSTRYQEVVGTLAIRDDTFRTLWARHDVERQVVWPAQIRVGTLGAVDFVCHSLAVPGPSGQSLVTLTAKAGSAGARLLQHARRRSAAAPGPAAAVA